MDNSDSILGKNYPSVEKAVSKQTNDDDGNGDGELKRPQRSGISVKCCTYSSQVGIVTMIIRKPKNYLKIWKNFKANYAL